MVDADATQKFDPPHNHGDNPVAPVTCQGGARRGAENIEHRTEML